ncbi:hypothetical protein QAD02_009830 [Eretmocerus hayati]|uniref:Uncharacterized protein n=1 Tax=Eretmocerus hayati TaxID=131215 RepID=A0ACC2NAR6_9HYME|nr:hypothetical protein QAD02_009830 [Eretmocerus hayati]
MEASAQAIRRSMEASAQAIRRSMEASDQAMRRSKEAMDQAMRRSKETTDEAIRRSKQAVDQANQAMRRSKKATDEALRRSMRATEEIFGRSSSEDCIRVQTNEERFKVGCKRLTKEGSWLVEEDKQHLRQKVLADLKGGTCGHHSGGACRVKIKWKANQDDPDNGGYNHENLHRFLSKHGEVSELVFLTKKGRALVEYTSKEAAESAVNRREKGLVNNPLELTGMWEKTKVSQPTAKPNFDISYSLSSLFPTAGDYLAASGNFFQIGEPYNPLNFASY